jgi:2-dehydro-3-deoxygalactonokinase
LSFIALDWGTTSFRAYHVGGDGAILANLSAPEGILAVKDKAFDETLESRIGAWDKALPIMASGMITSRQGWIELPYVACPADLKSIAAAVHAHTSRQGRKIFFVPGISACGADGVPDVIRGEETQVLGASEGGAEHFVAPGTHSKWIDARDGSITGFATYMTGEVFAVLKAHSILGRLMAADEVHEPAFERGVAAALADPGGFLHRIFSARTLPLFGEMPEAHVSSYLSGQVIGTEIAHAAAHRPQSAAYRILATPALAGRYLAAMRVAGLNARLSPPEIAVKGLWLIAKAAGLIQ